jgi:hypothetical protein
MIRIGLQRFLITRYSEYEVDSDGEDEDRESVDPGGEDNDDEDSAPRVIGEGLREELKACLEDIMNMGQPRKQDPFVNDDADGDGAVSDRR